MKLSTEKPFYWFSKPVVKSYTATMLKMDVHWHTPLYQGARIIAANHPSTTDPFFVASMVGSQSFILIKSLLFQVPLLGSYLHHSGHIPVAPGCGQSVIDAGIAHLKAGHTLIIFPEGDLSPAEGGFLKAHTGVARLALESGAPVIPVGIDLQRERIHNLRSTVNGIEESSRWYITGRYNLTVGQPLYFSGNLQNHVYIRRLADIVMDHIIELAHESAERMDRMKGNFSTALEPT